MKHPRRPHVLISNDDGIEAEGLRVLVEALHPHADLMIVAPNYERSGAGHGISFLKDLHFEACHRDGRFFGWGLNGTPADCVKVAVTSLAGERPFDMVVSGINRGQNAGINILYSGTVAAAREAALLGLPAVALSLLYHDENDLPYETAARVGVDVFKLVHERGLPPGVMLNVNVPPLPYERLKGWAVTRMGDACYADLFLHEPGADGRPAIYRNVGEGWVSSRCGGDNLDDHLLFDGYVSITPLHFDLTAYGFLAELTGWFPATADGLNRAPRERGRDDPGKPDSGRSKA
ncbi:MAG: 5'/3'-nucleotidase SurE [bacterium]|nr:5'/3'-nucleotidase SurE [bacterium]